MFTLYAIHWSSGIVSLIGPFASMDLCLDAIRDLNNLRAEALRTNGRVLLMFLQCLRLS